MDEFRVAVRERIALALIAAGVEPESIPEQVRLITAAVLGSIRSE